LNYKFQYNSTAERDSIIANNVDKVLIEEQNINDGDFLVFTDVPGTIDSRLTDLEDKMDIVILKLDGVIA
jgi:hypothetical protein